MGFVRHGLRSGARPSRGRRLTSVMGLESAPTAWAAQGVRNSQDRLEIRAPPGPGFSSRSLPVDDLTDFFSTGSKTARFRYEAVLMTHGSATEVADEVPPTLGTVEPVSDEKCFLRMGSNNLDHLAVWTAAFGCEFEVVEPSEPWERLRDLTSRLQRSVGLEGPPSH